MKLPLSLLIWTFVTSGLVSGQSVAEDVSAEELEDSFLVNPKYRYSFKVFDDDKQVYQDQSQQMADRIVTGQFSWVDALGTRHVTVYRADESGYHILEMRREVGAVAIAPKNEPERPKKIQQNRIAIANSRSARLLERSRTNQDPEVGGKPETEVNAIRNSENGAKFENSARRLEPSKIGSKKIVRVVKRPKIVDSGNNESRIRKPVVTIPANLFDSGDKPSLTTTVPTARTTTAAAAATSSTTTTTTMAEGEVVADPFESSSLEDLDEEPDSFLPTFASFSQIEPSATGGEKPKFVPQPVRVVPIPILNRNNFVEQIPILNTRNQD